MPPVNSQITDAVTQTNVKVPNDMSPGAMSGIERNILAGEGAAGLEALAAQYNIQIKGADGRAMPEGLAKVLEILQGNVAQGPEQK